MARKDPVVILLLLIALSCGKGECQGWPGQKGADVENLRKKMVRDQIESRGIQDKRVLEAMSNVPRHEFVPGQEVPSAYEDHPLPIGHGQTISQPYIVALMSELCELDGTEKVLEIGTGSGYQAAVLSKLSKQVFTIEIVQPLGAAARNRLERMGYGNVHVRIGDGYRGWPEEAPFDVIILTASPPEIPETLLDQLAEGGILVAPEGEFLQELVTIRKTGKTLTRKSVIHVRFVPMIRGKE